MAYEYSSHLYVKKDNQLHFTNNVKVNAQDGSLQFIQKIFEKQSGQWIEVWVGNLAPESGTIVAFQGALHQVPIGWAFCDGLNGTPDLRDRFIMGGTSVGEIGGGSEPHTHTLSTYAHSHVYSGGSHTHDYGGDAPSWNGLKTGESYGLTYSGSHSHTTSSSSHDHGGLTSATNRLAHYTLAYIMKI